MSLRTRRLNFAFEGPDWGPLQPIGQCRICILKVFATLFQLKKSMLIVGGMFSKSSQLIDEMTSWTPTDWRDDGLNTEGTACLVPTIERAVTLCAHSFSEDFFENQTSSLSNSKRLKRKLKPNCFKDSPVTAFCTINGKTRSDFTWHANLQIRRMASFTCFSRQSESTHPRSSHPYHDPFRTHADQMTHVYPSHIASESRESYHIHMINGAVIDMWCHMWRKALFQPNWSHTTKCVKTTIIMSDIITSVCDVRTSVVNKGSKNIRISLKMTFLTFQAWKSYVTSYVTS